MHRLILKFINWYGKNYLTVLVEDFTGNGVYNYMKAGFKHISCLVFSSEMNKTTHFDFTGNDYIIKIGNKVEV